MLREGDTLADRYRLTAQLGCGGMAEVWLAHDVELDRRVAVKLLAANADRVRVEREARAYASCSHSNVACVYDYGEVATRPYIVLEYLPQGTLEDRLTQQAPLRDADTIRIARETAAGMAHAHSRGLVHRDLKPANILFDDEGHAKIADFGIAHATDASTFTEAGTILGTAAYASPEQASGEPATPASDVYSFGVILFRMLTGRLPFTSANPMKLLMQHAQEQPPPVSRFRDDAPPQLTALTASALAKDPRARPRDGGALLAALSSSGERPSEAAATAVLPPPSRRPTRRAAVGGAAALMLLVSVGFAAALLVTGTTSSEPTPAPATTRKGKQQNTLESRSRAATPDSWSKKTTESRGPTSTETNTWKAPTQRQVTKRARPSVESTETTVPTEPTTPTTSTDSTTTETTGTTTETTGTTTETTGTTTPAP